MALQIHKRRKDGVDIPVKQTTVESMEAEVEEKMLGATPVDGVSTELLPAEEEPLSTETIYSPPAPVTLTTEIISEEEMARRVAGGQ
jgi:hypothetical protein